ncbi:C-X-C motif chemokine 15 [Mesocricetus auratus]|uniref:C-X-C motif chemokine 15 n=1 Tax=Mesocricetus auratus TaxID=10036 RepID=A0A3Q0CGP2_MESAU|nr:C-X-C motif chemokine 15 [Mesocricetus auratus]
MGRVEEERKLSGLQTAYKRHSSSTNFTIQTRVKPQTDMAAVGCLAFLLVVISLGILAHPCGTQELRCQCIQIYSDFLPLMFIKSVWLIPEDIYCSKKEVIVLLKNGNLICLDPETEWVKALIIMINTGPQLKNHIRTAHPMDSERLGYLVELRHPPDIS